MKDRMFEALVIILRTVYIAHAQLNSFGPLIFV